VLNAWISKSANGCRRVIRWQPLCIVATSIRSLRPYEADDAVATGRQIAEIEQCGSRDGPLEPSGGWQIPRGSPV
jgi:hypothetical protein